MLILLLLTPRIAGSDDDPRIKQFRVVRHGDEFSITAILKPAVTPEIEALIHTGMPTTFEYYTFLKKVRWYWDNKILAHAVYRHTVTYDTLRKIYHIVIIREGVDNVILDRETASFDEILELMSSFNGTLTFPFSDLTYDSQYYVSIQASLKTRQVPSPWHLFLSDDFQTRTSRKFFP